MGSLNSFLSKLIQFFVFLHEIKEKLLYSMFSRCPSHFSARKTSVLCTSVGGACWEAAEISIICVKYYSVISCPFLSKQLCMSYWYVSTGACIIFFFEKIAVIYIFFVACYMTISLTLIKCSTC